MKLPRRIANRYARALAVTALERATGRRIGPEWRIDPDLIGGFRAEVGSMIIDGSIKARLDALRERLEGAPIKLCSCST